MKFSWRFESRFARVRREYKFLSVPDRIETATLFLYGHVPDRHGHGSDRLDASPNHVDVKRVKRQTLHKRIRSAVRPGTLVPERLRRNDDRIVGDPVHANKRNQVFDVGVCQRIRKRQRRPSECDRKRHSPCDGARMTALTNNSSATMIHQNNRPNQVPATVQHFSKSWRKTPPSYAPTISTPSGTYFAVSGCKSMPDGRVDAVLRWFRLEERLS